MNRGKEHPLPSPPPPSKADDAIPELVELLGKFDWATDTVERCARTILNDNSTILELSNAVQELKQLLCTSRDHVFSIAQEVLDSGVLVGLVQLAGNCHFQQQQQQALANGGNYPASMNAELRVRAAFCLTNIAAGSDDQTAEVVKAGGVGVMLELLRHPEEPLRRQAIFCLANIAGSTPEFRALLAEQPAYVSSLKYAIDNSSDLRMEELVGWNLRNMVVLGGATFEQCVPALDIFSERTLASVPNYQICFSLMVNGIATFTSVEYNAVNWFKFGPGGSSASNGYLSGFMSPMGNRAVLRFAGEALSHVSRHHPGRMYIFDSELVVPILYLAKFSPNPTVRNYMLETLVNLSTEIATLKSYFFNVGAMHGLAEMLADSFSYSPHQRVLVAKFLWKLADESRCPEIDSMTKASVVTRAATIETKRDLIQSALLFINDRPPSETQRGLSAAEDRFDDLDLEALDLPRDRGRESLLAIAYAIFSEYYGPEELSLREKCGRLIVSILLHVNANILSRFFSAEFLQFIIQMAEFAAQVDVISINSGKLDALSSMESTASTEASVADVMEALKVGEYPSHPEAMFLLNTLKLIERVFKLGENLRQEARAIDNPISAMIKSGDGVLRLETCVSQGALPLEVVNDAFRMIEKFAY